MGPSTLAVFSTIGIILLMFFIGIELNLKGLRRSGFNRISSYIASKMVILDSDDEVVLERLCEE